MGLFDFFKKVPHGSQGAPEPAVERRIGELVAQLSAPDWQQRVAASVELGKLGVLAESAQAALEEATCDEHNEVCTAAAHALSSIRRALDAAGR